MTNVAFITRKDGELEEVRGFRKTTIDQGFLQFIMPDGGIILINSDVIDTVSCTEEE